MRWKFYFFWRNVYICVFELMFLGVVNCYENRIDIECLICLVMLLCDELKLWV